MSYNSILDNLIVIIDGEKYFVGELANCQSEFILSTQSEKRISSVEDDILFRTVFALLDGEGESQEEKYNLVTGLPVDEYKHYKEYLESKLRTEHNIELIGGESRISKSITIDRCKIIPQLIGTVFNELLTDSGEVINKEYVSSTIGVVDIGFRTTDFIVTDKLEFIDKLSYISNIGLNTAYKHISRQLKDQFNVDKPIYQLDDIIRVGAIDINGQQYDVSELREKAFSLAAKQIVSDINSFWHQLWEYNKILITGGGGVALFKYIRDHIDNVCLVEDGQFSNVNGYLKVANRSFKV